VLRATLNPLRHSCYRTTLALLNSGLIALGAITLVRNDGHFLVFSLALTDTSGNDSTVADYPAGLTSVPAMIPRNRPPVMLTHLILLSEYINRPLVGTGITRSPGTHGAKFLSQSQLLLCKTKAL
jgi:hypothetical protein